MLQVRKSKKVKEETAVGIDNISVLEVQEKVMTDHRTV